MPTQSEIDDACGSGPFYVTQLEKDRGKHGYAVMIAESVDLVMLVFDRITEEMAIEFCKRLNKAVARYNAIDNDNLHD